MVYVPPLRNNYAPKPTLKAKQDGVQDSSVVNSSHGTSTPVYNIVSGDYEILSPVSSTGAVCGDATPTFRTDSPLRSEPHVVHPNDIEGQDRPTWNLDARVLPHQMEFGKPPLAANPNLSFPLTHHIHVATKPPLTCRNLQTNYLAKAGSMP